MKAASSVGRSMGAIEAKVPSVTRLSARIRREHTRGRIRGAARVDSGWAEQGRVGRREPGLRSRGTAVGDLGLLEVQKRHPTDSSDSQKNVKIG